MLVMIRAIPAAILRNPGSLEKALCRPFGAGAGDSCNGLFQNICAQMPFLSTQGGNRRCHQRNL